MFSTRKLNPKNNVGFGSIDLAKICATLVIAMGLVLTSYAGLAKSEAAAQSVPLDRTKLAKELNEKHAETPIGMGLANNGGVMELFSSEEGDTWTLILTMPNGASFLVGSGESWAGAPLILKGKKI